MGLHLDPTTLAIIGGTLSLLVNGIGGLLSASVNRNIRSVDDKLGKIDSKLDGLGVEVGHLRERVAVLEDRAKGRP